jgi:hypothetical protein
MYPSRPRIGQIDTFGLFRWRHDFFGSRKNRSQIYPSTLSGNSVARDRLAVKVSVSTQSGAEPLEVFRNRIAAYKQFDSRTSYSRRAAFHCVCLLVLDLHRGDAKAMSNYFSVGKGAPILPRGTTRI